MDIVEAVNKRKSIRSFKADPVPQDTLRQIMELALRAPSWANTQPWQFAIVGGKELDEIRRRFVERAGKDPTSDIARPHEFPEPYGTRRGAITAKTLEVQGIRRDDKEARDRWQLKQFRHLGAPNVIYICIDRSFYFQAKGINAWPLFDCGLVAENIMLLAAHYGLGTIPQAQAVAFPDIIREVLGIPDSKIIVLGIAIGYPDWGAPVNQFRSEREPLEKVARWYGFDQA